MQKFNACKKRDWLIHFFFSTSSDCIIAICPVGPPKEMNPSLSQNRNASPKLGCLTETPFAVEVGLIVALSETNERCTSRAPEVFFRISSLARKEGKSYG